MANLTTGHGVFDFRPVHSVEIRRRLPGLAAHPIPPTATTQTDVLLNEHAASQIDRRLGAEGAVALPALQC